MPVELNLPGLRKDRRVRSPARGGVWSPLDQLDDLAAALVVEAASMPLREIKSVPHTWGHVIVFETALLDERHPSHRDAKGQWRALLALLALRNRPGYPVEARPVALGRGTGEEREVDGFTRVAGTEKLNPRIQADCTWDPVHLLYAEPSARSANEPDVLIGLLSPSTIVAPARDFSGHERLNQFWARNGLRDPLSDAPGSDELLSPDELEVCRRFTMNLRDKIRSLGEPRDAGATNTIVGLLEEFARNLDENGAGHHIASWTEKPLGDLVARDPGELYEAVNSVWEADGTAADVTDLELGSVRIGEDTALKIVLADPGCVDTLGKPARYISLFGQRTLADLPAANDGTPVRIPDHLRSEAANNDILLLGPGDLLTDRLTALETFNAPVHPRNFQQSLLPVKAAALLLFSSIEELAGRIERLGSASRPRVGLRVTLTDRDGRKYDHQIAREYADDAIEKARAPEALAAWPDFRPPSVRDAAGDEVPGWKWNYLFTSTNVSSSPLERSAIVTSGVSRHILERDLARAGFGEGPACVAHCRNRLEAWSSEDGPWEGASGARFDEEGPDEGSAWFEWLRMRSDAVQSPQERSLQRSDSAFEAVLFQLPSAHGAVYAGLGILPGGGDLQTQDPAAGGTAQIAIDFGTSNTIVYCKRGEGTIEPLSFTPRLRRFNEFRNPDGASADREAEYTAFMPGGEVSQPFATVMQLRSAEGVADLAAAWKAAGEPVLWRDYAFFDPDVLHLTENLLSGGGRSNLIFDLKWGTELDERTRMGRYLRHIAILSLAEVVGHRHLPAPSSVTWHFSYPMTVSGGDAYREVMRSSARSEWDPWNHIEFRTESNAALDYFREVERAQPQSMLVLDIGGGSTDIALAARGSGVWQHSVRLAGDDLMTEFLLYNRHVLEALDLVHIGRQGVFGDRRGRDAFMKPPGDQPPSENERNAAKAIINSPVFGRVFARSWFNVRDAEAMKLLKVGASVMMGGLCAFLGRQIRSLLRVDSAPLAAGDLTSIRLCFGGRGSTLFKLWRDDEVFEGLMGYLSEHAAADLRLEAPPEVTTYFSHDMKHEVAKGMLARRRDQTPFPSANPRVVGVGARLDADLDATLFMDDIRGKHRDGANPVVAWDEFNAFLERVGRECGFRLTIARATRDDIASEGKSAFVNLVRDQGEIEPPFIAMLRKTLSLLFEGKGIKVSWDLPQER